MVCQIADAMRGFAVAFEVCATVHRSSMRREYIYWKWTTANTLNLTLRLRANPHVPLHFTSGEESSLGHSTEYTHLDIV
jgi:hypothetical protein